VRDQIDYDEKMSGTSALIMNDPATLKPISPAVELGIRGLDNLTNNMIGGGLYILIAETPSARFPVLAGSIGMALEVGLPCTVIVPSNPESFIQRIETFDKSITPDLITSNRLQLYVMQDDFSKTVFRYGAEGFVKELDHFEVPDRSYLVFDQADELLSLHDLSLSLDQVDVLGKWLDQRQITALLVFSRVTDAHSSTLNALMDSLTGIARLGGDRDGLELTFDYWQSPDGTVAAKNYRLITLESGLYEASTKSVATEQLAGEVGVGAAAEADDAEPHFFYMDPDLNSVAKQMPGVWERVDTLVGMMHATRATRSGTAILRFQPDTNLRQLSETVHTLRLTLGHRAHIVVQEKGASLRYQNEALLLRLGANLVVHKDVATSRLPLLLESLRGQIFSRDVNINFEAALASVTPSRLRGYLLPARFVREVNLILNRAETLNVPYAMVIGKPAPSTTMVDLLMHIKLSRSGDLITADSSYCYLFLNACPQTVLLATLERVLGGSLEASLDAPRFLVQRVEVEAELAGLTHSAGHGDLPDYSSLSETTEAADAPVADKPVAPGPDTSAQSRPQNTFAPTVAAFSGMPSPDDLPPQESMPTATQARPMPVSSPRAPVATPTATPVTAPATFEPAPPTLPVFGKKEVPWATRSTPPAGAPIPAKSKPLPIDPDPVE
jgi:cellulose biosynthesis protein BcsE